MAVAACIPQPGQLLPVSTREQFVDALRPGALQCAEANDDLVCVALQRGAANTKADAVRLEEQHLLPAAKRIVEKEGLAAIRSNGPHLYGCGVLCCILHIVWTEGGSSLSPLYSAYCMSETPLVRPGC